MALKIHKVYTKTGDSGSTSLTGGKRIEKDSLRIESYGTIDELQAQVGVLRAGILKQEEKDSKLPKILHHILNDLFDLGAMLATPPGKEEFIRHPISKKRIEFLEEKIDFWSKSLSVLPSFVLSGGGELSSLAQVARCVCRRAERVILRLHRKEKVNAEILAYINRLSDFLFVLGRHLSRDRGEKELLWETPLKGTTTE